jgi:hypothetical protein
VAIAHQFTQIRQYSSIVGEIGDTLAMFSSTKDEASGFVLLYARYF